MDNIELTKRDLHAICKACELSIMSGEDGETGVALAKLYGCISSWLIDEELSQPLTDDTVFATLMLLE